MNTIIYKIIFLSPNLVVQLGVVINFRKLKTAGGQWGKTNTALPKTLDSDIYWYLLWND